MRGPHVKQDGLALKPDPPMSRRAWAGPLLGNGALRGAVGGSLSHEWFLSVPPSTPGPHPGKGWPSPHMWRVLMRKRILSGQWASCLTAGKGCLREEEGCTWREKSSLPNCCSQL